MHDVGDDRDQHFTGIRRHDINVVRAGLEHISDCTHEAAFGSLHAEADQFVDEVFPRAAVNGAVRRFDKGTAE